MQLVCYISFYFLCVDAHLVHPSSYSVLAESKHVNRIQYPCRYFTDPLPVMHYPYPAYHGYYPHFLPHDTSSHSGGMNHELIMSQAMDGTAAVRCTSPALSENHSEGDNDNNDDDDVEIILDPSSCGLPPLSCHQQSSPNTIVSFDRTAYQKGLCYAPETPQPPQRLASMCGAAGFSRADYGIVNGGHGNANAMYPTTSSPPPTSLIPQNTPSFSINGSVPRSPGAVLQGALARDPDTDVLYYDVARAPLRESTPTLKAAPPRPHSAPPRLPALQQLL